MCFFINLRNWDKLFSPFVQTFSAGLSSLLLTCPSKQMREKFFRENCVLSPCDLEGKNFDILWKKKSDGLSKFISTSPVEHSQDKCMFLETATIWRKKELNFFKYLFVTLGWNFLSVCQKIAGSVTKVAFFVSAGTKRSKLFWKTCVSINSFGLWMDFVLHSSIFCPQRLPKLPYTCPYEHFEENFCSEKQFT